MTRTSTAHEYAIDARASKHAVDDDDGQDAIDAPATAERGAVQAEPGRRRRDDNASWREGTSKYNAGR